jgi:hypothetical protein
MNVGVCVSIYTRKSYKRYVGRATEHVAPTVVHLEHSPIFRTLLRNYKHARYICPSVSITATAIFVSERLHSRCLTDVSLNLGIENLPVKFDFSRL